MVTTNSQCNPVTTVMGLKEQESIPDIPALQGQYSSYIVGRLKRWKEAPLRDDDLMSRVASELGPDDMQAVSTYFEQLPNAHDGEIK